MNGALQIQPVVVSSPGVPRPDVPNANGGVGAAHSLVVVTVLARRLLARLPMTEMSRMIPVTTYCHALHPDQVQAVLQDTDEQHAEGGAHDAARAAGEQCSAKQHRRHGLQSQAGVHLRRSRPDAPDGDDSRGDRRTPLTPRTP